MIDESRIKRVAEEKIGLRLTQDGMLFADWSQDELVEFARAIEQLVTDELAARVEVLRGLLAESQTGFPLRPGLNARVTKALEGLK